MTIRDLCTQILQEINVTGQGETPSASDIQTALNKLRLLLNFWNANRQAVYASRFSTFTLTPSLNPTTIGPTGATWTATQRPVSIDAASVIVSLSNPAAYETITIRDAQWWATQNTPTLTSTYPTDLYYQPDWPNGNIFFWPVPTGAYEVQIQTRVVLDDAVELDDTFSLPPGYALAILLSTAELCFVPFAVPMEIRVDIREQARMARAGVFPNNDVTPRLQTADFGMQGPAGNGRRADFNFRTGGLA